MRPRTLGPLVVILASLVLGGCSCVDEVPPDGLYSCDDAGVCRERCSEGICGPIDARDGGSLDDGGPRSDGGQLESDASQPDAEVAGPDASQPDAEVADAGNPDAGPACEASTTCNGHGTCDGTGGCICSAGFTGMTCNQCATNCYGYPACTFCGPTTCGIHGSCDDTGKCVCTGNYTGPACDQCPLAAEPCGPGALCGLNVVPDNCGTFQVVRCDSYSYSCCTGDASGVCHSYTTCSINGGCPPLMPQCQGSGIDGNCASLSGSCEGSTICSDAHIGRCGEVVVDGVTYRSCVCSSNSDCEGSSRSNYCRMVLGKPWGICGCGVNDACMGNYFCDNNGSLADCHYQDPNTGGGGGGG